MYYKLVNQDLQTRDGFQWKLGKWYKIDKASRGHDLCSKSWFHCYDDRHLAVLLNPSHASIPNPRLFRCNVRGKKGVGGGDKFGFTQMRLVRELELPAIGLTQRIAFGILCAKEVCQEEGWNRWADAWLDGSDRTKESAEATAQATWAAVRSTEKATWAVVRAATWAVVRDADWAVARAAVFAADWAAETTEPLDLKALAKEAMKY